MLRYLVNSRQLNGTKSSSAPAYSVRISHRGDVAVLECSILLLHASLEIRQMIISAHSVRLVLENACDDARVNLPKDSNMYTYCFSVVNEGF